MYFQSDIAIVVAAAAVNVNTRSVLAPGDKRHGNDDVNRMHEFDLCKSPRARGRGRRLVVV